MVVADETEARRLREAARAEMRAARRHRRRARDLMAQLDAVIVAAAEQGIHINVNHQAQGGPNGSHNGQETSPGNQAGT